MFICWTQATTIQPSDSTVHQKDLSVFKFFTHI